MGCIVHLLPTQTSSNPLWFNQQFLKCMNYERMEFISPYCSKKRPTNGNTNSTETKLLKRVHTTAKYLLTKMKCRTSHE